MQNFKKPDFCLGLLFMIVGLIMFLRNVWVGTFYFYRLGGWVNTGTVVLILMICCFMAVIIKPTKTTKSMLLLSFVMLIIVIILSIDIHVARMSILSLIIMLSMMFGGLALMIRHMIKK